MERFMHMHLVRSMQFGFGFLSLLFVIFSLITLNGCGAASNGTTAASIGTGAGGGGNGTDPGNGANNPSTAVFLYGQLWKTDGTPEGTAPVYTDSPAPFSFAYGLTQFNGEYYFQANNANGFELWKTDGTPSGTVLVKDINPGSGSSFSYRFSDFTVFNNALYFHAQDGVTGSELWKTDGTAQGTVLVKDINPAPGTGSAPSDFTVFNGQLYFSASSDDGRRKLWKTDGSADGTTLVTDLAISTGTSFLPDDYSHGFPVFNGALYFAGPGGLWKTDGTAVGTVQNEDIATPFGWFSYLYNGFAVFGDMLYVAAEDQTHGREIWKTNGSVAGTALLKDINTENGGRRSDYVFNEFIVFNGELYFQARDNVNNYRLWKTNGNTEGTVQLQSFGWSPASGFMVLNGALYFQNGGLWKTDGTPNGAGLVKGL